MYSPPLPNFECRQNILVVDDEPLTGSLCQHVLGANYYVVNVANTRRQALRLLHHSFETSLVLLDLSMPGFPVEDVLDELTELRSTARVLLCGRVDEVEADLLRHPGVRGFLRKPFEASQLVEAVRAALEDPALLCGAASSDSESEAVACGSAY